MRILRHGAALQINIIPLYYSSAGHHEQKNKKATDQIESLVVTRKQRILRRSLCKSEFNVLVQLLPLK